MLRHLLGRLRQTHQPAPPPPPQTGTSSDDAPQDGQPLEIDLETARELRRQFKRLLRLLHDLPDTLRAREQGHFTQYMLSKTVTMETPRGPLHFVPLGRTGGGRGMTMLEKQPATIEWIDGFQPNSVFWDVGANIGVYALYAALRGDTQVMAFEPAAVNYFALSANCEANAFGERVRCLLMGLGQAKEIATLEVSQFAAGMSFSFREKRHTAYPGRQAALILSVDQLIEEFGVACPNYIKIDVPGLSADIIGGARRTLSRPEVREVHIEVRPGSSGGQRIIEALREHGLVPASSHSHGSADMTFSRA